MSVKGDADGLLKELRQWPTGVVFNRLYLPTEFRDKWIMNDLTKRGFLIDLGQGMYQTTDRKNAFHKRKRSRRKPLTPTSFTGRAGRVFNKMTTPNLRAAEILKMRAGGNGEPASSYQQIADRFNVSRQRVGQILKKNGATGQRVTTDPNFLTTTEAAKYLSVSYRSIYDWSKIGTLPFFEKRIMTNGKVTRLLFRREDLDAFKQQKLLTPRRSAVENQGLKPLVVRLLQLGDNPHEIAKLSGVNVTTIYTWMYEMPGRDKRVGQALGKILSGEGTVTISGPAIEE